MNDAAKRETDIANEALVTFLQALALAVLGIDDLPRDQRTPEAFIRGLDGYLDEVTKLAEREGSMIRPSVELLRKNFDTALRQANRFIAERR